MRHPLSPAGAARRSERFGSARPRPLTSRPRDSRSELSGLRIAEGSYDIILGSLCTAARERERGLPPDTEQVSTGVTHRRSTSREAKRRDAADGRKERGPAAGGFDTSAVYKMYSSAASSTHSSDSDSQDSRLSTADFLTSMANSTDIGNRTTFVALDGLNSGVPTRTTATLTPTTLRNIEQTFIELQCEVEPHQNEAGFVPPVVQPVQQVTGSYMNLIDNKGWQGGVATVAHSQPRPTVVTTTSSVPTTTTTTRRNMGGRRPTKNAGISPEEEERRRVRRERNKMAAARCRKRRLDHTNALLQETEGLEQKKQGLQQEIQQLQMEKEELEFILEAHKTCCRLNGTADPPSPPDVKPMVTYEGKVLQDMRVKRDMSMIICGPPPAKRLTPGGAKPPRPNSLPVAAAFTPSQNTLKTVVSVSEIAGVPITTPTAGIPFNFDSLMEGGTGLTPVSGPIIPSCSSQQRNSGCVDLASPDSVPSKLVSL